MTLSDKINRIRKLADLPASDMSDEVLTEWIGFTGDEIWMWTYGKLPETEGADIPVKWHSAQVQAVIDGLGKIRGEGQTSHSENGISRAFKYESAVKWIHANLPAYTEVL